MEHAESTFEITGWDEEVVVDAPGYRLIRTQVTKTFSGDVAGTSVAELLMLHTTAGPAAYVGFERLSVTVGGRRGDFGLHHNAGTVDATPVATWSVVPGSGTGELTAIVGGAQITRHEDGHHTFTLDYDLD